jgi:tetratricopeptide (TPR) repeat protein
MKRSAATMVLIGGLVLAGGCAGDKKQADSQRDAASSRYQILNGSTSGSDFTTTAADPKITANTHFAAGQLAESQNRPDAAIPQYEAALKINPTHVQSLYRLGIVYTRLRKFDQAVAIWNRYIKATDQAASSYGNLGFCYEAAGDLKKAESAYQQGIARDSKNLASRTNYGLLLARQNRIDEARAQLSTVLKPDEVEYDLATVYQKQGAIPKARQALRQAIQINPRNQDAKTRLAQLPPD